CCSLISCPCAREVLERIGSRRLLIVAALATAVIVGVFSVTNLASSTVYYLTPSEAKLRTLPTGQLVRLGGLVKVGSLSIRPLSGPASSSRSGAPARRCTRRGSATGERSPRRRSPRSSSSDWSSSRHCR